MPRFYINFRNRDLSTKKEIEAKDDVGVEVAGLEQARAAALASAREVAADNVRSDSSHPLESVFITDESGREVMTIPAKDILPETLK
jgi:hypothetical protein